MFKLLKQSQVYGKDKLEIFKYMDIYATLTDFAVLIDNETRSIYNSSYYLKTLNQINNDEIKLLEVSSKDKFNHYDVDYTSGIRPCIKYSSIKDKVKNITKINENISIGEIGYYPQNISNNKELSELFIKNKLIKTNKTYHGKLVLNNNKYNIQSFNEYEYNNNKYIIIPSSFADNKLMVNKEISIIGNKSYYFIEVKPLKIIIDTKNDIALTKDIILKGIPYFDYQKSKLNPLTKIINIKHNRDYYKYNKSFINQYLEEIFTKDLLNEKLMEVEYESEDIIKENNIVKEIKKEIPILYRPILKSEINHNLYEEIKYEKGGK